MTNNSRPYDCSTKFCSYVTTGRVFQIALRGREYSYRWEEWEILLEENFFSLVTNSSRKLEMNIYWNYQYCYPKIYYFHTTYK